jgi:hypothetical protein
MGYKTIFSTFLTGQLRSMAADDREAFQEKMTEIRLGRMSHHKVLQGTGNKTILTKVGKTKLWPVEECSCGLGGKWRIFFYRTGYVPRNTLEAERRRLAIGQSDVPDGMLWCALVGHLEGGDIELYTNSKNATTPGPKTPQKTVEDRDGDAIRRDASHNNSTIYQDEVAKLQQLTG